MSLDLKAKQIVSKSLPIKFEFSLGTYPLQRLEIDFGIFCLFCFLRPHPVAFGILVPQPGIKPMPLLWECGVLTTGPPGKSLTGIFERAFKRLLVDKNFPPRPETLESILDWT